MLKVFIADDNRLIRQSLRKRIDWTALGMTCVGEAENGQQALDLICNIKPDIVIMDIRMPGLDGLQVMHHVREKKIPIQFIIISGYDDFAYLKQAIRLQAVNYILKPIHTPELIESLHQATQRCAQTPADASSASVAKPHPTMPQPQSLSSLSRLYKYGFTGQTHLPNYIFCIGINIPFSNQRPVIFSQECIHQIEQTGHALFFPSPCHAYLCARETLILMVGQTDSHPVSDYLFRQFKERICALTHLSPIYFACSDTKESSFLPGALRQSVFRLLDRFSARASDNHTHRQSKQPPVSKQRQLRKKLEELIELRLYESCCSTIAQYFSAAKAEGWYASCLITILRFWRDCLLDCGATLPFHADDPEVYALQFSDSAALEHTILNSLAQLYLSANQPTTYDKILAYIHQFYAEPLSLQQLSKVFHLNQAYLGQLIKKSSGLSFHALLNRIRLEKAEQILQNNNTISIKDLAGTLGFTDAYYFTRVFKQQFGQTPSEYRRIHETNHMPKR